MIDTAGTGSCLNRLFLTWLVVASLAAATAALALPGGLSETRMGAAWIWTTLIPLACLALLHPRRSVLMALGLLALPGVMLLGLLNRAGRRFAGRHGTRARAYEPLRIR